eukprot:629431-Prymnesium_polylepis.1
MAPLPEPSCPFQHIVSPDRALGRMECPAASEDNGPSSEAPEGEQSPPGRSTLTTTGGHFDLLGP